MDEVTLSEARTILPDLLAFEDFLTLTADIRAEGLSTIAVASPLATRLAERSGRLRTTRNWASTQ